MNKRKTRKLSNFYHGQNAIFLGNGINLLSGGISWDGLLKKLILKFGLNSITIEKDTNISYPLLFEEILFNIRGNDFDYNLKQLKAAISKILINTIPNEYHHKILRLNTEDIITTNYDYAFERCIDNKFTGLPKPGKIGKYKYSLYRKHNINGTSFWHINGELNNGFKGKGTYKYPQESILIGNEHYADYLRKLHETLRPSKDKGGLINVLEKEEDIWARLFFTHNIHIIGFDLNYSEIHLWWLLNFRARLIKKNASIANKIFFYYPSFNENKYKLKIRLLKALEVNPILISVKRNTNDKYQRFYDNILIEYGEMEQN